MRKPNKSKMEMDDHSVKSRCAFWFVAPCLVGLCWPASPRPFLRAMTATSTLSCPGLDSTHSGFPPCSSGIAVVGSRYRVPGVDPAVGYLSDCEDGSTSSQTIILASI